MDKVKRTRHVSKETSDAPLKRVCDSEESGRVKRTRRTKAQMAEARTNQLDFITNSISRKDYLTETRGVVEGQSKPESVFKSFCSAPRTTIGWINIYYHASPEERNWYYTGSDIHDTKEKAISHAQKNVVGQVQINYPLKEKV
jgi:hypothetical protein